MRDWFKYEFGYVNFDEKNIYFTNTGNWSEVEKLTEKDLKSTRKSSRHKTKINTFIYLFAIVCALLFLILLANGKNFAVPLVAIGLGGYFVYNYLKRELGPAFYIPYDKITQVEFTDKNVLIHFLDAEGTPDEVTLVKVDQKGKFFLESLQGNK